MLAGIGVGAVAVQTLHAQAKPPIYRIAEIQVTDVDAYISPLRKDHWSRVDL
jgi:hypothetical protein